ncbi:hypothetical protein KKH82_03945 [Patescibacteria group bacterium]|nr:hypothetical protein [Patescibacteria group bacterium]
MFEPKESKDFFIGEIMNYLQSVGKSISTINEQITEEIQEKKETKTIEQSRSKAREDYDKLAPELKPNADQLSNRRQVLEDL